MRTEFAAEASPQSRPDNDCKERTNSMDTKDNAMAASTKTVDAPIESNPATSLALVRAVKLMGNRALRVVDKAAAGRAWTPEILLRAADAFDRGDSAFGLRRPWSTLAARLRRIARDATKAPGETAAADQEKVDVVVAERVDACATEERGEQVVDEDAEDAEDAEVAEVGADNTDIPDSATVKKKSKRHRQPKPQAAPETETKIGTEGGATLTFAALCSQYLAHLASIGKAAGTVFSYTLDLGVARRHFGDERDVRAITFAEVAAYFESDLVVKGKNGKRKSEITIRKLRRTLRMALERAAAEKLIERAPVPEKVFKMAAKAAAEAAT
jgi:hypothetical protein